MNSEITSASRAGRPGRDLLRQLAAEDSTKGRALQLAGRAVALVAGSAAAWAAERTAAQAAGLAERAAGLAERGLAVLLGPRVAQRLGVVATAERAVAALAARAERTWVALAAARTAEERQTAEQPAQGDLHQSPQEQRQSPQERQRQQRDPRRSR